MVMGFGVFLPATIFAWSMNFESELFFGRSTSMREMGSHGRATVTSYFSSAVYTAWRTQAFDESPATVQITQILLTEDSWEHRTGRECRRLWPLASVIACSHDISTLFRKISSYFKIKQCFTIVVHIPRLFQNLYFPFVGKLLICSLNLLMMCLNPVLLPF